MKRALALLLSLLMALSLFPATAFAEEETTQTESPAVTAQPQTPEPTAEPTPTPAPEGTPTEALASESPSVDALFLTLQGCDELDSDGTGHAKVNSASDETWRFTAKAETNGSLFYRWQKLDVSSSAADPYVDLDVKDIPTANDQTLVIAADAAAIGVADFYRCVVTAALGEETMSASYCFTVEPAKAEESPAPEAQLLPQGSALEVTAAGTSAYATSRADIVAAIAAGATEIICSNGSFAIDADLKIPSNVNLYIKNNYTTVTVNPGVTLTNEGYIGIYTTGTLDVDGTLKNAGTVEGWNGGTLNVDGTYAKTSTKAKLVRYDTSSTGIATIIGVAPNLIDYVYDDATGFGFYNGLDFAKENYASKTINLLENATITATDDVTIPSNTDVYMQADFTLESGGKLTNNGTLYVLEGTTLYNHGEIQNNGEILVFGSIESDGTITGNAYSYLADITSEAALRDALSAGTKEITLKASFSLAADLTIPSDVTLILDGFTLTVPSGITLSNEGVVLLSNAGRLTTKSGGTFSNNGFVNVGGGTLSVESGGTYLPGEFAYIGQDVGKTNTISGIPLSQIQIFTYATNESMIRAALNYSGRGYRGVEINVMSNVSLSANLTLASDVSLYVGTDGDGVTLTIPSGKTLLNNGYIAVRKGNTLQINSGATLMNASQVEVYGTLVNNGTLAGSGSISYGDESVSSWAALRSAVEAKRSYIYLYGDITAAADLTVGPGTTLILEKDAEASLTIPGGVTLTLNGGLNQTGGALTIGDGGTLVVNGNLSVTGGTMSADSTGALVNNGFIDFSGDASGSFTTDCYTAGDAATFVFNDQSGASIGSLPTEYVTYWFDAADSDALSTALGVDAAQYNSVSITLSGDAQVGTTSEIAANAYLVLADGVTLTIGDGDTLTVYGTLDVGAGATLKILAGGTLIIEDGARLCVSGDLLNEGTIERHGDYSKDITTQDMLETAIADGVTQFNVVGNFTLTKNITIPANTVMALQGSTLSVLAGKTLQIDGTLTLIGGTLNIAASGKLTNNNTIILCETSRLTVVSGGVYTQADAASLSFTYGRDTISGIPNSKINCDVEARTEAQLRAGLALSGYRNLYVTLLSAVTLTSNLTVLKDVSLTLTEVAGGATLTIPAGRTMTNSGDIILLEGSVLDVKLGGTLNNTATGSISLMGGTLIASGTVTYADATKVYRMIRTEEELTQALSARTTYLMLVEDITLSSDVTLPDTVELAMADGKTLTVPSGITLNVGATHIWLADGALSVAGTLSLADGGEINIDGAGSLLVSGTISFGGERAGILFHDTGASTLDIPEEADANVTVQTYVSDTAELLDALSKYEGNAYRYCEVYLNNSITLSDDVTVPEAVQLWVDGGKTLTIPAGVALTIQEGGTLRVEETGKIVVAGTLDILGSAMIALGSATVSGTVNFPESDSYYTVRVSSQAQMKAAIDTGKRPLLIWGGGFTITTSMTIPKDVHVWFDPDSSVTIGAGVTLTNNGIFGTHGKLINAGTILNNHYFKIETYATFTNNGTFNNQSLAEIAGTMVNNGSVVTASGCRVRFLEGAVKSGTNAGGTWFSLDGTAATGIEVVGPAYLGIGEDLAQKYAAQMIPTDAWPVDVVWSIADGDEYATIDETSGILTGLKKGDVKIHAASADDETLYGEFVVHVVEYAIAVSGNDSMVAGKTQQLSAKFVPSNLTKATIVWSMDPADLAYASVSTTGLVLAKAVTEPHTVTVKATASDNTADAGAKEITIYPALSAIQILDDSGNDVTNKTLVLNSNLEESVTLSCALIPTDAMPDVSWTLSLTDAATLVTNSDGSVTLTSIKGKSKLLTLTVKSNDGSGKTASVKIQVASISSGLTVSGATDDALYSGRKVQLVATFDDPKPSNTAVKWVMSPEYETYATLSATGLLTAKTVTQAVVIQVSAVPADGGPESAPYEVTIKPLTGAVMLKRGDDYVTGTTQTVDLGHEPSLTLTAVTWPDGADDDVVFTSNMPSVATVDETGTVTLLKNGVTTITATAKDGTGKNAVVRLNVVTLPQAIEAVSPALSLRGGANAVYRVKDSDTGIIVPANLVRWRMESGDAVYASLTTGGVLNAYQVTKATTITLTAEIIGNEEIACTNVDVTIYPTTQRIALYQDFMQVISPVTFDVSTMPDGGGASVTLTAKLVPADAMEGVTWTSSNLAVAKVVDGVVSPVWNTTTGAYNKGSATITAKTKDGTNLTASALVQVVSLVGSLDITTSPVVTQLVSGASVQLKATLGNKSATNTKVNYSITSGAEFVTLSASGVLTAKPVYQEQTVTLLARAADGSCEDSMSLTIAPKDTDPLVIQTQDGSTVLNGTLQTYDVSSTAVSIGISANGFASGLPVAVKWSVSSGTIARVETSGGVTKLRSLGTGTVTITATDSKGRTASFTAEFYKPAKTLTINPPKGMDVSSLMLASGRTMQLSGVIAPTSGVTTSGVNWFIAADLDGEPVYLKDTNLASISASGLLSAKPGIAEPKTIKVYAVSKNAPYLSNSIEVTLTPAATGIDLFLGDALVNNATMSFDLSAKTLKLSTVIYPADANQTPAWTTSNKAIATVAADGTVTALKAGTVTITATADGKSVSIKLNILVRVTGLEITSKTGFTMRTGSILQLAAAFTPTAPSDKRVTWKLATEDFQYATISSTGLISARAGTQQVTITAQAISVENSKVIATKEVTIYPATTMVQILDAKDTIVTNQTLILALNSDTEMTLSAQNLPMLDSGALQSVTWKSSNTTVLKVAADGTLSAVWNAASGYYNTGTVTITATAADGSGKSASVKVFVGYLIEGLTFADGLTVQSGKLLTLKPTFEPVNATNKTLKWVVRASDTPFATISAAGVLTAKKVTDSREIVVYCYAQDGSGIVQEVAVTITP